MAAKTSYLYAIALLLLVVNLLVGNGMTTLWDGAEAMLAWQLQHDAAGPTFQEQLAGVLMGSTLDAFLLRASGALAVVLGLIGYYIFARRLVGTEVVLNTLALAAASLLMSNLAKVASGDVWAMMLQWLAYAAMIRYLKQPQWSWQVSFYALFALAIWVQPLQALIFLLGTAAFLYFMHADGRRLLRLNPWAMGLLTAGGLYALQVLDIDGDTFYIGFRTGRFGLANLLGILPFLGLVMGGIWEHLQRLGKRDEQAVLYVGALIFALLGHSLALQPLLAMIAARQLRNYFHKGYPYRGLVKAGAVLHLVAAACFLILFMIGSFVQFRGLGFQAGLATGGLYWIWSFIAVVGLLGQRASYVRLGTIMSGILLTTFFWIQFSPLLEAQRNWAQEIVKDKGPFPKPTGQFLVGRGEAAFPSAAVYAFDTNTNTAVLSSDSSVREAIKAQGAETIILAPQDWLPANLDTLQTDTTVCNGWNAPLQPAVWVRCEARAMRSGK
ncbi:MAG: glycosyltransferase family 39 protein [Phaeodactylibacter sp.]|uniref:glycosyltransferase family 39 protein n=1 Tax=Phaeodactylibacter sp. TaxID=1940289 RepID=UPI0032F0957D